MKHMPSYGTPYPGAPLFPYFPCSQSVANFLNVSKFQPTTYKSTKQLGFSFAFDALVKSTV